MESNKNSFSASIDNNQSVIVYSAGNYLQLREEEREECMIVCRDMKVANKLNVTSNLNDYFLLVLSIISSL